jgi:hypothetical protein
LFLNNSIPVGAVLLISWNDTAALLLMSLMAHALPHGVALWTAL